MCTVALSNSYVIVIELEKVRCEKGWSSGGVREGMDRADGNGGWVRRTCQQQRVYTKSITSFYRSSCRPASLQRTLDTLYIRQRV